VHTRHWLLPSLWGLSGGRPSVWRLHKAFLEIFVLTHNSSAFTLVRTSHRAVRISRPGAGGLRDSE
jgi:hypothetical protein